MFINTHRFNERYSSYLEGNEGSKTPRKKTYQTHDSVCPSVGQVEHTGLMFTPLSINGSGVYLHSLNMLNNFHRHSSAFQMTMKDVCPKGYMTTLVPITTNPEAEYLVSGKTRIKSRTIEGQGRELNEDRMVLR